MIPQYFLVTFQDKNETQHTVRATGYDHAAAIAARKFYGRKRGLQARRTTGDSGKSGYFCAYLPCSTGGASSHGKGFHVRET